MREKVVQNRNLRQRSLLSSKRGRSLKKSNPHQTETRSRTTTALTIVNNPHRLTPTPGVASDAAPGGDGTTCHTAVEISQRQLRSSTTSPAASGAVVTVRRGANVGLNLPELNHLELIKLFDMVSCKG